MRSWIDDVGVTGALTRLVDVIPAGATSALELLESPITRPGLRTSIVVEETADLATEGAARCAAASPGCTALPVVANPTMTIPVERSATTCFTLVGSALSRFSPVAGVRVLRAIRVAMTRRDVLLVGLDLRSREARQADGVAHDELLTAWHRHALSVANRELGLDFAIEQFRYQCRYDAGSKRLEEGVACASRVPVTSPIMEPFTLRADEQIRIAVQYSYGRVMLESMLRGVGLALHEWREAPDGSHGLATVVVHAPRDEVT